MGDKLIEKYIWIAKGESCSACESLDSQEFKIIDEIPDKPHPNCDCFLQEVEAELCDCGALWDQIEEMIGDAEGLKDDSEAEKDDIKQIESEYSTIDSDYVQGIVNDLISLEYPFETLIVSTGIFISNFLELLEVGDNGDWVEGTDKYYHAKANCQSAQLGVTGSTVAKGLSDLKEYFDSFFYAKAKKVSLEEALKDSLADQEANREGRELGRKHPTKSCGDLLKHRRPKGLPEKYR